jgi:cell division inhibitor SepF
MSVLDKFLNAMKMNDDDGFEEDDYFDEEYDGYDDYEDERPKKRILTKSYEDDDYEDTPSASKSSPAPAPAPERTITPVKQSRTKTAKSSSKISPMRPKRGSGMEVCVIKPRSMEDAREITETLLEECTVVLNMEGLDLDVAQRIIDFSSGSCYAMHGNLQKISNYIFIITPESVDISGDFQEILSGAFDVPSFGTRF